MQPAQTDGARILRSARLLFFCANCVLWQGAAAPVFADDDGNATSVGDNQTINRRAADAKQPDDDLQPAKRRVSLRIRLDSAGEPEKAQYLLADAAEITDPVHVDDVAADDARTVKLRKNVRLWLPDETMSVSGDQAFVVVQYQKNSKTVVRSVKLNISGNVHWSSGRLDAIANEVSIELPSDLRDVGGIARVAECTLRGNARVTGKSFYGTADRIDIGPRPEQDRRVESPIQITLSGKATLSRGSSTGGNRSTNEAELMKYVPEWDQTHLDGLTRFQGGRTGIVSNRPR